MSAPIKHPHLKYRPEIDGLRALAVVPVILFHAGLSFFSGGFVGVDVFFVISGYLITTILLKDLDEGNFSILFFYERRARRILPALFVVLLVCLPFAWFWLLPKDMTNFSQSLASVSVFVSNIFFWRTSSYFDTATALKPLVHTWSLAVEEQYYVLFPLFLLVAWKFGRRSIVLLLVFIGLISFAISQYLSKTHPAADYYLLPSRAWELMIGALVAFYYTRHNIKKHRHVNSQYFSLLGFVLVTIPIFAYDNLTPFPGVYALAPTIGAALIIIFTTNDTLVGRLLGSKLFVGIGLISYSAYLWHQAMFAFARHHTMDQPGALLTSALILSSLLLAYLSWRFVERPFRNRHIFTRKQIFVLAAVGSIIFAGFGLWGIVTKGRYNRYDKEQASFANYYDNYEQKYMYDKMRHICNFYNIREAYDGNSTTVPLPHIARECFTRDGKKSKSVFIWGDSHSQMLYWGLKTELPSNYQILQVASSGCYPKLNAHQSKTHYCEQSNWFAFKTIRKTRPDVVIVAQDDKHNLKNMLTISRALKKAGVKHVIFTGPSPHWQPSLPDIVAFRLWGRVPVYSFYGLDKTFLHIDDKLKSEFPVNNFSKYLSISQDLCTEKGCRVYIGDDVKKGLTTWDYGHITPITSIKIAKDVLVPAILKLN